MSKDIWHTPPEQPDPFKSWNVLVVYEANDRKEMMYSTQFLHATDGMYINRWCYLDDLMALETENINLSDKIGKLESELDRTRKALEIALDAINRTKDWYPTAKIMKETLDKITALEQKDIK